VKAVLKDIGFELEQMVVEELPLMSAFHAELDGTPRWDVQDLFAYFSEYSQEMPFYTLKEENAEKVGFVFEDAYHMLIDAADRVFRDRVALNKYFDCAFLRKHGRYFTDFAEFTFRSYGMPGQAIYGRFDAAMDPESETVTGIYEFNGNTPVMLFESVNLQNHLTIKVTGDNHAQYNNYYPWIQETLAAYPHSSSTKFAVVLDTQYVDDAATCETMTQLMGEDRCAFFSDLDDITYEYQCRDKPFFRGEDQLDALFVLLPWEEIVENWTAPFMDWEHWCRNVSFMEPAWRWFISHKGMLAYVTHLLETDDEFRSKWGHVPTLRSYLSPDVFVSNGLPYVAKPVLGRLSSNVRIFDENNVLQNENEGHYGDCECVYQEFHAPGRVEGRNNFIVGMWMAPKSRYGSKTHEAQAATFCIREFDEAILQLKNERFIPHLIV
jgi:glutathionylspermidine synthase